VAVLDLDFEALVAAPRLSVEQQTVSRFPSSDIDLAFEVPEALAAQDVERAIRRSAGSDLRRLELFDVYRGSQVGEGKRGLGFRLRFQADDRTLTDAEVAGYRAAIVDTIESELGATLRG
jgi:phenylalanyl-tRNA synthetase beta chain